VATALSLACLAAPSYATGDDYPYAGLGQCPLVPLPPKPADQPGKPGKPGATNKPDGPHRPGDHPAGTGKPAPHQPGAQATPDGPDTTPPPRQCAKHIWFYNGSYGDPWGFALRNCTSFVAWRLRMTNGLADFENHFGGVHWGNAAHWDEAAAELGYPVDDVPAVGAVAQTDDGPHGHVAWVAAVGEGTVTVEEYNLAVAGGYDERTVPVSSFRYLHLDDVSPAPYLGSTRAGAATTDAHGGSWSARTTADGELVVRRPSGHTGRLRTPGGWSGRAAAAMVTDDQGRVWVAAVAAGGRVMTAHTSAGSAAFTRLRQVLHGATTSSPALAVDGAGRVHVLAIGATGTLLERHTRGAPAARWTRPHRMGLPGSWSTHAAPAAVADAAGRVWVAAVTRRGALQAQHTAPGGRRWSGFRPVDHETWSVTSTPALAGGADGRVWLAGVGSRGDLVVRHTGAGTTRWQRGQWLAGQWSTYSSPSLIVDQRGRTWVAAVDAGGRLAVRSAPVGGRRWHASGGLPRVRRSELGSPALTTTVGGVLVGMTGAHDQAVWRRPLGQAGSMLAAHGPRGGGFTVSPFL
jgi:surface antigen